VSDRPAAPIHLGALARGTAPLTPARCANLVEAAVVCWVSKGHASGAALLVDGAPVGLTWDPPDPRAFASRADSQEATEHGATAAAIVPVRAGADLDVVERSWKGTGFDYFLARSADGPPFARAASLEVSGILDEDEPTVQRRLREKVAQVARGGAGLPGYAVVVGFRAPRAAVRSVP
jgi:hypothetical protein